MTERESFLAQIAAEPDDDTVRLVFADWLQDHGEENRAVFIRDQIAMSRGPKRIRFGFGKDDDTRRTLQTHGRGCVSFDDYRGRAAVGDRIDVLGETAFGKKCHLHGWRVTRVRPSDSSGIDNYVAERDADSGRWECEESRLRAERLLKAHPEWLPPCPSCLVPEPHPKWLCTECIRSSGFSGRVGTVDWFERGFLVRMDAPSCRILFDADYRPSSWAKRLMREHPMIRKVTTRLFVAWTQYSDAAAVWERDMNDIPSFCPWATAHSWATLPGPMFDALVNWCGRNTVGRPGGFYMHYAVQKYDSWRFDDVGSAYQSLFHALADMIRPATIPVPASPGDSDG